MSVVHLLIASGCMSSAPQPPRPPALAIAIASEAGQAPAIGAIRIGTRRLYASQNASARTRASCLVICRDILAPQTRRDRDSQSVLTAIFLSGSCASGFLGSVTV